MLFREPVITIPNRVSYGWGEEHWFNADVQMLFPERSYFFKVLTTRFPKKAHVGFNSVYFQKQHFIDLIKQERDLVRALLSLLQNGPCGNNRSIFENFREQYIKWNINKNDFPMAQFIQTNNLSEVNNLLKHLEDTRSQLISFTHAVNFENTKDHIILVPTGTIHSIMGLSLQSHPKQNLPYKNKHTKNEAWIYLPVYDHHGSEVDWFILEIQELSNDTYSYADFFASFEWKDGRPQTRKPLLDDNEIEEIIADGLLFEPKPQEAYIKKSEVILEKNGIVLKRYIDDKALWPFFSIYEITCNESGKIDTPLLDSHHDLFVAQGSIEIMVITTGKKYALQAGEACIISEELGKYTINASKDTKIFVIGKESD